MDRLKLLGTATLFAVALVNACSQFVAPPPTGSIAGRVTIEGQGIDAITVTLSNGVSTTTAGGGTYRLDSIDAGTYTVTISDYPQDADFNVTSTTVTLADDGQVVTINFRGSWIRTSRIMGWVTVEDEGLPGVAVAISGMGKSETLTDDNGQYSFSGLRAGNYTIEISGFDSDDIAFGSTSSPVTVGVGESKAVVFEGTYIRTARLAGTVTAEGEGLSGIRVELTGVESKSARTGENGSFSFTDLRSGNYTVEISDWDPNRYFFENPSDSFSLAVGEQEMVNFMGTHAEYTFRVKIENISPPYLYSPSGYFSTPVGDSEPGLLTSGKTYAFEFEAGPGAKLTFATMMVHSNDLFYAPGPEGIALWDGHTQITGNVTDQVQLWDAGTEVNQEPGVGADQPLQGGPGTGDFDPDATVRLADDVYGTLPVISDVIRVMLESTGPTTFRVSIDNVSTDSTLIAVAGLRLEVPLAPGVFVVHHGNEPLFTPGQPDRGQGLEALAEDGNPGELSAFVESVTGVTTVLAPGIYASHAEPGLLFKPGATASPGVEAMAEDGNPTILGAELLAAGGYRDAGAFAVPVGGDGPGALFPGRMYAFNVTAVHGEHLSFVTMFVQSNDIFFAPHEGGIDLFPDHQPLDGLVSDMVMLWDAGTEVNQKPGIGIFQALRQLGPNTGEDEMGTVRLLDDASFTYPAVNAVIRVSVTPVSR